jgi:hypothetical protein
VHDVRVLANVAEGRGEIIDNEDTVGGYPDFEMTKRKFDERLWNLDDMSPRTPEALDSAAKSRGT